MLLVTVSVAEIELSLVIASTFKLLILAFVESILVELILLTLIVLKLEYP